MRINGKTALVAGGTRGIGLAVARRLAVLGARLIIPTYDWPEDTRAVEEEFSRKRAGHLFPRADLRNPGEVRQLAEIIADTCGCLHILINNIERGGMPIVHGSYDRPVNSEQWRLELDTTLLAKRLLFENCLPLLKKAEEAAVVNITSIAGIVGRSGPAGFIFSDGYSAANRGVSSLTATWARIGAPSIRVNEIMLGLIDSRHGKKTRGWNCLDRRQKKSLIGHTLLGRTGRPEEVARTVLFLIRDAGYMTGSVLLLDGGYILGGDKVPAMPDGVL